MTVEPGVKHSIVDARRYIRAALVVVLLQSISSVHALQPQHLYPRITLSENTIKTASTAEQRHLVTPSTTISRRSILTNSAFVIGAAWVSGANPAQAAETVGKDDNCNDRNCLGIWDGLLADCPHNNKFAGGPGCTSSQDDTPGIFAEPWDYSETLVSLNDNAWKSQLDQLEQTIQLVSLGRGDQVTTTYREGRYLRVLFTDGKTKDVSVGEFYFTPNDTTVQFRVAAQEAASGGALFSASFSNQQRCELIRQTMRYQKLPVLRNRKRSLFFVESDLDTFGPGSAALGPPAEMRTGELDGRPDIDPRLNKVDLLQQFPVK